MPPGVRMRIAYDDSTLHHACKHGCDRCTDNSELRCTEFAKDQHIVEEEIDKNRQDSGSHRNLCLSRFPQRAGIDIQQRKKRHLQQHNIHILSAEMQGSCEVEIILPFMDKQGYQLFPNRTKQPECNRQYAQHNPELEAHTVFDALMISLAVILRRIDARSCKAAEYAEIKDEKDLIDNRHTGHRFCSDTANHDIVKK